MQDMLLQKNDDNIYDIVVSNGTIQSVDGLESAILVSLFTDARASSAIVGDPLLRRGWVGNILVQNLERELGSVLWLADQARTDQNTLNFFQDEVRNAFQWMLDDNVVSRVTIATEIEDSVTIKVSISFLTTNNQLERYVILWRATD